MLQKMAEYILSHQLEITVQIRDHLLTSLYALLIATAIGVVCGYFASRSGKAERWISLPFSALRVVPSLAILVLLIPVMGTGRKIAVTALVLLAVPPILLNTMVGFREVPDFMLESAAGIGMDPRQILQKVRIPLALPLILAGVRTAMVEVIASATLAAKIGGGGLGEIIFTGLGLNRSEILLTGGIAVAMLSLGCGLLFDAGSRKLLKWKTFQSNVKRRTTMRNNGRNNGKKWAVIGLAGLLGAAAALHVHAEDVIRVGSKDFTENEIVAELYALALEDEGYKVERIFDIASSVIHTSILNDEIDLYPEYTGTGLISILQLEPLTDPQEVYDTVKAAYEEQFSLTWLAYAQANDGQGLFISKAASDAYGITTISDLQAHADELRFASQGEFDEREDGLPGLEKVYGPFNWKSSKVYDNGLKYNVVENDEADVSPAYTTEGRLSETDKFVLLEDDKQVWPPYNLAPVVRDNVLEVNPQIEEILDRVDATLDTATITALNARVDVDKEEYEDVAAAYYETIKEQ